MKKHTILLFLVFAAVASLILVFGKDIYSYFRNNENLKTNEIKFLYGSKDGEHGRISLKIGIDNSSTIKEVYVTEHPDNEYAVSALQKLISSSLDKQRSDEIDSVTGATETTNVYKSIIDKLLSNGNTSIDLIEEGIEKISIKEPEVANILERQIVNPEGFKSGLGGYVMNKFEDADYNKNGNLVTHEYVCAVLLNPHNRIEDVKFDHIASNLSFDRQGKIPTGGAKAYTFASDKEIPGFNGMINDGNYVNIYEFEKMVLTYRHFEEIKSRYLSKKGYAPLIYALENAIDNARTIGASDGDTLGLSVNKILKKKDIIDSTDEVDGKVIFNSDYCLITTDKERNITSCAFDNVYNPVTLTSDGKILGSREKEIYTLNELSNTLKYTKIDSNRYNLKLQLNLLADFIKGNSIDNLLTLIKQCVDDKGVAIPGLPFESLKDIDFIEYIDLISRAFIESVKIRVS